MTAEIISVGTELLLGQTVDTNAAALGRTLASLGVIHRQRQTVGDNLDRLVEALRLALSRSDLVITIGGLGPTQDDLTRDGIALALDDPLVLDPEIEARLREMFARRRYSWTDSQLRQAMRPSFSQPMVNPNGTAPGLICERGGKRVIALPGPPNEFGPMVEGALSEYLGRLTAGAALYSTMVRVCGMGESIVEHKLRDLVDLQNPTVAPYAKLGEVHMRVSTLAGSNEEAQTILGPVITEICSRLGRHAYGFDDVNLEAAVIGKLTDLGQTVSVAESMTGGALGARLTSVSGASKAFVGGVIAYQASVKVCTLGLDEALIERYGTVSEPCALAMAERCLDLFGSDHAIAITGNAGPTVDTVGTPVGKVFVAHATAQATTVSEHDFPGDRDAVRRRATQAALTNLWFALNPRDTS